MGRAAGHETRASWRGRADIRIERVHQDAVGTEHVAGILCRCEGGRIDEQCTRCHLLHVQDRADLSRDLVFDVVALVERERDIAAAPEPAAADDFVQDAEQLERIGGTDDDIP